MLFSLAGANAAGLTLFDPTTGNTISVPTQGTNFITLTPTVTNGVVYGGGGAGTDTTQGSVNQVFAIRVDQAVQQLREFVVDSQLMQDFDDPSQPSRSGPTRQPPC